MNILERLPIKSIIRCTAVCKSWYDLISSPNFISTSLNRKQNEYLLIQNYEIAAVDVYALFGDNRRLYNYLDFSFCNCSVRIVGSLNGILCLSDVDNANNFYFCNPSIRKWIQLPEPSYVCQRGDTFGLTLGFGFDAVTNDFKVVRIAHSKAHAVPPRVDIYKYNTGIWEDISHVSGSYLFSTATPYVYVNGACHWITSKLELKISSISSCRKVIVMFNMHDETFSDMILPCGLTDGSRPLFDEMFLYVSEESLCLVSHKYDINKPIDIWMMREYGVPDSWVKQFSIQNDLFARKLPLGSDILWAPYVGNAAPTPTELEIDNEFMRPMAIKNNGEILWKGNRRLLVSVDYTVDNFKDVDSGNCTNDWCCDPCGVSYYTESLVLLDRWKNICIGDACEESSDLWKREPKDGKRRISRGKSKYKMRIASLLHISGLLYMSKMKWKWLRKKGRKSMKVKKPSLSN